MKVPKEVAEKIAALEKAATEADEAERRTEAAEKQRQQKLAAERQARAEETREYAKFIRRWCRDFLGAPEAERIWRLKSELTLFVAKFWRGEPCSPGDATCWATLSLAVSLAGPGHDLLYSEWHKGQRSFKGKPLITNSDLVNNLHPDFLKQLYEHLNGPDAWRYVVRGL